MSLGARSTAGYSEIAATAEGGVADRCALPLARWRNSAAGAAALPVIGRTMQQPVNVRVRNVARIGGNLAHGDPHMDLPPVLSSLGATAMIVGPSWSARDHDRGAVQRLLRDGAEAGDELIASCRGAAASWAGPSTYLKCTTRSADDWPALGVARR